TYSSRSPQRIRRDRGLTYLLVSHDLGVIAHMCGRLLVMQGGRMVEELAAADLAGGTPAHPYTRQLLVASRGYDRAAVDAFEDYGQGR
ncbi:MAG: hypothetical protein HC882_02180, partial [Acidobacteria bacterium]|nr:hypothetical protein [Acidobacteriota bacterium]